MNLSQTVNQMAHLKQKQISDNSCKAIIIDTLLEKVSPLTKEELIKDILSQFHVLIMKERIDKILASLVNERILLIDSSKHVSIEPMNRATFIAKRQGEIHLRETAIEQWISFLRSSREISRELENNLVLALPVFLRTLFVKHGVKSYELLSNIDDDYIVDMRQIAGELAEQYDKQYRNDIKALLPTVFQCFQNSSVVEFLIHGIKKAVGYVCEVISPESLSYIETSLSNLTLYLDTNVLYRLLHLQGDARYESIKETIDFCRKNNVKLKISAATKKEFSARLKFDSQILKQYPAKTDFYRIGYKFRSSDNYVSAFWAQNQATGISVDDYIQYYKNFDVLLSESGIETEEIGVDEETLIDNAKRIYGKLSQRDSDYVKNSASLWHDAYSIAYVRKMQKADAQNAIDAGCLFLTTDQSITLLQREDPELKNSTIVALSPSQLLQMFGFTKPDCGYEETFIKFFASSSLGTSFDYDNNDIQEIISRISHYDGVNAFVAETILARELINTRYLKESSDEEKEEIVYEAISEELLRQLKTAKDQVEQLTEDGKKREKEYGENQRIAIEGKRQYEEELIHEKIKNQVQEELYINTKVKEWRAKRLWAFWGGIVASACIIITAAVFSIILDSGHWGILGLLTASVPLVGVGSRAYSVTAKNKYTQGIKEEYMNRLMKRIETNEAGQ